ncbi:hypothetical protein V2J09_003798 [Rumex salicifolius]
MNDFFRVWAVTMIVYVARFYWINPETGYSGHCASFFVITGASHQIFAFRHQRPLEPSRLQTLYVISMTKSTGYQMLQKLTKQVNEEGFAHILCLIHIEQKTPYTILVS